MLRTLVAVVLGSFVATGLFFLMQALVASGQTAITEETNTRIVDFVRVKREERLESKRAKPDRPPNPDEAALASVRKTIGFVWLRLPLNSFRHWPIFETGQNVGRGTYLHVLRRLHSAR